MSAPSRAVRREEKLDPPSAKRTENSPPDRDCDPLRRWASNRTTLGSEYAPTVPRRQFLRIAGGAFCLAVLSIAVLWGHFQATHIVTRNALVRSHLSSLGLRAEGIVREVLVSAGDVVQAGELLAQLEDQHLLARQAQAKAAVDTLGERITLEEAALVFARREAQIALASAEAEYRRMRAEAEAARARADDAVAFAQARESLGVDGAVSAEMIRNAAAKAATQQSLAVAAGAAEAKARAELVAAQLSLESLALGEAELRVLVARHREAEANLARVDVEIGSTKLYAPADGAVVRRLAQPGMAIDTGTPLLNFWLSDDAWIEAWIPERKLGDVAIGSPAVVSFPAIPGERFPGTVARIGLATDFEMPADYLPQNRQARMRPTPEVGVQIRLHALPSLMRPGMSAIVDIPRSGV